MNKIIHIGWYRRDPVGGVGKTILEQTRSLADAGADVEIWHLGAGCSKPEMENVGEKYPVWKLPAASSRFMSLLRLPQVTREWIESRKQEIGVLHLHSVFIPHNILISRLAARLGIPYVITPNGGWNDVVLQGNRRILKKIWIGLFERPMWSRAAFIQGVSLEEIRQIRARRQMAPIRHIPNGTQIPDNCSAQSERDRILYVGRYDIKQKGLDVMLEAIRLLVERGVSFPRIILAGPDYRGGKEALEAYVDQHQLTEAVELRGPVQGDEKDALFRRALLFIHTSRWEGLPLVLLEAISYGIPCLLTPGTNVAAEWASAGCAFEVPFDTGQIAHAIERAVAMDLTEAGSSARRLATAEYSWQRIACQLMEMYNDAVNESHRH